MTSTGDDYLLTRESTESERLNEQHNLYVKSLGYLLHPAIAKQLPSNPRIADVATGTAIFLQDIADRFPNARLDGFDISSAQFPNNLASNTTLHVANCKEAFANDFHGKFDVVHLRLLITAMEPPHDWEIVARHAVDLLKPGGAIQWSEGQFSQLLPVLRQDPHATTDGLETLYQTVFNSFKVNRLLWDLGGIKSVFQRLGLENVKHEVVSSDCFPETRSLGTKIEIGACYGALKATGSFSEQELHKMIRKAQEDMNSGAYTRWDIHCHTAFKPS